MNGRPLFKLNSKLLSILVLNSLIDIQINFGIDDLPHL